MSKKSITFAGHSAVFVTIGNKTIAVDPWLEGNPSCPPAIAESPKCDLIVLTHGHSDHAGDAVRVSQKTGAPILATFELIAAIASDGFDWKKLIPMNKGGSTVIDGVKIALTHALHSNSFDGSSGPIYAGEACGVVLKTADWCVYHAGDTCAFSDMSLIKEFYRPDVAFLPIGDYFTMGPKEAAFAASLVGARTTIPVHFATFGQLTGTAEEFSAACRERELEVVVLKPGEQREF